MSLTELQGVTTPHEVAEQVLEDMDPSSPYIWLTGPMYITHQPPTSVWWVGTVIAEQLRG